MLCIAHNPVAAGWKLILDKADYMPLRVAAVAAGTIALPLVGKGIRAAWRRLRWHQQAQVTA